MYLARVRTHPHTSHFSPHQPLNNLPTTRYEVIEIEDGFPRGGTLLEQGHARASGCKDAVPEVCEHGSHVRTYPFVLITLGVIHSMYVMPVYSLRYHPVVLRGAERQAAV